MGIAEGKPESLPTPRGLQFSLRTSFVLLVLGTLTAAFVGPSLREWSTERIIRLLLGLGVAVAGGIVGWSIVLKIANSRVREAASATLAISGDFSAILLNRRLHYFGLLLAIVVMYFASEVLLTDRQELRYASIVISASRPTIGETGLSLFWIGFASCCGIQSLLWAQASFDRDAAYLCTNHVLVCGRSYFVPRKINWEYLAVEITSDNALALWRASPQGWCRSAPVTDETREELESFLTLVGVAYKKQE